MNYQFDYSIFSVLGRRAGQIPDKLQALKEVQIVSDEVEPEEMIKVRVTGYDDSTNDVLSFYTEFGAMLLKVADAEPIIIRKDSMLHKFLVVMKKDIVYKPYTASIAEVKNGLKRVEDFKDDEMQIDATLEASEEDK